MTNSEVWDIVGLLAVVGFMIGMVYFAKSLKRLEDSVDRVEAAAAVVAAELVADTRLDDVVTTQDRMERATEVVADNLEASIDRADSADDAVPGKSADAALRRSAPE